MDEQKRSSCIVCGGHSVASVGALFARGKLRKMDNGHYDLPEIPQLPVCEYHAGWSKWKLETFAKQRMEEMEE